MFYVCFYKFDISFYKFYIGCYRFYIFRPTGHHLRRVPTHTQTASVLSRVYCRRGFVVGRELGVGPGACWVPFPRGRGQCELRMELSGCEGWTDTPWGQSAGLICDDWGEGLQSPEGRCIACCQPSVRRTTTTTTTVLGIFMFVYHGFDVLLMISFI